MIFLAIRRRFPLFFEEGTCEIQVEGDYEKIKRD
jgi:hypothetical protein